MYRGTLFTSRDSRVFGLTPIGTDATVTPFHPAWMIVSIVYV